LWSFYFTHISMHYKRKFCGRFSPRAIGMQMVDHFTVTFEHFTSLVARIIHELLSRDREDGHATWQLVPRYRGIGSEAYLNGTSQGPTPEDARKDGHIRGCSK
jgi:hypothetical protein